MTGIGRCDVDMKIEMDMKMSVEKRGGGADRHHEGRKMRDERRDVDGG